MAEGKQETFYELLDEFDTAMLVTRALDGELRARPMAMAEQQEGGDLWFATRIDSAKVEEIEADPRVNVTLQAENKWLSISGVANVVRDRTKVEELWREAWEVWFPEGKDDPELGLLNVRATEGEYWDQEGMKQLKFLFKAASAYLQDEAMEDDSMGHKVNLK